MAEAEANSLLGGYDEDFVNVVEQDEWNCSICQLPLKEAVQTGVCGHRFCRQCLDGHFMRLAFQNCEIMLLGSTVVERKRLSGEGNLLELFRIKSVTVCMYV